MLYFPRLIKEFVSQRLKFVMLLILSLGCLELGSQLGLARRRRLPRNRVPSAHEVLSLLSITTALRAIEADSLVARQSNITIIHALDPSNELYGTTLTDNNMVGTGSPTQLY